MGSVFVGIDVGTSAVKVLAVDEKGRTVAETTAPLQLSMPQPGWAEQDPEAWWLATCDCLRRLVASGLDASSIGALGLSGQMHSSVFLDASENVIRPALLWCDTRTTRQCRTVTELLGEQNLKAWVQNPMLEGFTLPKLLWLRDNEPEAFARCAKVVMPKDYVRLQLTSLLATEPSDASGTLMYDSVRGRFSPNLLDAVDLNKSLLPDLLPSQAVAGGVTAEAARLTGLLQGTPVVAGGADNACGALGVGVIDAGEAVASWGTSGTVLAPVAAPHVDPGLRVHTFCHVVPGSWYLMGVVLSAGAAWEWFKRELVRDLHPSVADARLNEEAASVEPGSAGLSFLPYLQGERTPHRDAAARGSFVGVTLAHTRAHMSRAVLEGICFALCDSLDILRELAPPIRSLLVTGGGAKSAFVRQLQADVYNAPLVCVHQEQGPALGAALLASVGAGAYEDVPSACRSMVERRPGEQPDPGTRAKYSQAQRRFRELYLGTAPAKLGPPPKA